MILNAWYQDTKCMLVKWKQADFYNFCVHVIVNSWGNNDVDKIFMQIVQTFTFGFCFDFTGKVVGQAQNLLTAL